MLFLKNAQNHLGGPKNVHGGFSDETQGISANFVTSSYRLGSRACLRALETLNIKWLNMDSPCVCV